MAGGLVTPQAQCHLWGEGVKLRPPGIECFLPSFRDPHATSPTQTMGVCSTGGKVRAHTRGMGRLNEPRIPASLGEPLNQLCDLEQAAQPPNDREVGEPITTALL